MKVKPYERKGMIIDRQTGIKWVKQNQQIFYIFYTFAAWLSSHIFGTALAWSTHLFSKLVKE